MNREERVKKYGSFLYCPNGDTLCFHIDNDEGKCAAETCCLKDPEYIKQKAIIEANQKKNWLAHKAAMAEEKEAKKNIRTQTKTEKQRLQEEIDRKSELAMKFYRRGWTRKGDNVTYELIKLNARLNEIERRKSQ